MEDYGQVTLDTIGHGAALEQFDAEFRKVLENLLDPNTEAKAIRKVTIELAIRTDGNRENAQYMLSVKSKLAPVMGYQDSVTIGRKGTKPVAYQSNLRQADMFTEEEPKGDNITVLKRGEG